MLTLYLFQAVPKNSEPVVDIPAPDLSGNFDIYSMDLPFLSKVYLPGGKGAPQLEALYKTILTYQTKNDYTAQCVLPISDDGLFASGDICDPMEETPLMISLSAKTVENLKFTSSERDLFITAPSAEGPGISADMEITEGHCMMEASGALKLKRASAWVEKDGGALVEIFEGCLSFEVVNSALYRRKRLGDGQEHAFAFWAIRARKDKDGKEISAF